MSWQKPLTDVRPPTGTATAKPPAVAHLLAVAAATILLWLPVIRGEPGLGGLCILSAWWALALFHVGSVFQGALGRHSCGAAVLAAALATGCAAGWVGLPVLVAVLVGSSVAIGLGTGWLRNPYPTAVGAASATLVAVAQVASSPVAVVLALVVGLAAFVLGRRSQEPPRRRGLRSLAFIIGGTVVTLLGAGILTMVVASNALTDADVDVDVSNLVTANFTDPDTIAMVSTFRSQFGHTYADSTRSTSSMKHYLDFAGEASSSPSLAPFDGEVFQLSGSGTGYDMWLRPSGRPNVSIRFFHIQPAARIASYFDADTEGRDLVDNIAPVLGLPARNAPLAVRAGELLGTGASDIDMAVTDWADPLPFFCTEPAVWSPPTGWFSPICTRQTRLVSVFEAMTPEVAEEWEAWGLTTEKIIVTAEEREALATFDAGLDPTFRPRGEQHQLTVLHSLGFPVIEGSDSSVEVEFPTGGVLLVYSTEGVRAQLTDGRELQGTNHQVDGLISPIYPQAPDGAAGSTFTIRLSSRGAWKAAVVPPEEIDRVVRPLASFRTNSGRYLTRGSGT